MKLLVFACVLVNKVLMLDEHANEFLKSMKKKNNNQMTAFDGNQIFVHGFYTNLHRQSKSVFTNTCIESLIVSLY